MADFCKQCSEYMFGPGYNDFAAVGKDEEPLKKGYAYMVLCEGCGSTSVNDKGECIANNCFVKHALQSRTVVTEIETPEGYANTIIETVDDTNFGCYTGDCPHKLQLECDEAIAAHIKKLSKFIPIRKEGK